MTVNSFLLDMKLMFEHAKSHSNQNSRLNRRITIHHLHFVVEQVIREKAKNDQFTGDLYQIGFEKIIKKLHNSMNIPDFNRLLELNTLRNNVQHQNQVCGTEEINLYKKVTEDFLHWSFGKYFSQDFDSLKTEDMLVNVDIKNMLLSAKEKIEQDNKQEAMISMYDALGRFKLELFKHFFDPAFLIMNIGNRSLAVVQLDMCLKIVFCNDTVTLNKLLQIVCSTKTEDGKTWLVYNTNYNVPKTIEKVKEEYDTILNLILTYQDNFEFLDTSG